MKEITENEIVSIVQRVAARYEPQRIILFGSYGYGSPTPYSDVDLLVVMDFEGMSFRKSLEILNDVNPMFSVDLLVRRPEDVERRYRQGDPLIREALDKGRVMYERDS